MTGQGNSFTWAKSTGAATTEYSRSITTDADGNTYTTGYFTYTTDFNPGPGIYNLTAPGLGFPNAFIQKLDANGNFVWARGFGDGGSDYGNAVTTNGTDAIYAAGVFFGSENFVSGTGSVYLTSNGDVDVYILKLDLDGNLIWGQSFGDVYTDDVNAITLDNVGNVYIVGNMDNNEIMKLDSAGNFIWSKQLPAYDTKSASTDANGNLYVAGEFQNTQDFDPGSGTFFLSSNGYLDAFLLKLDSAGNFIWAKSFGSVDDDAGSDITVDISGNVYLAGNFRETVDFDPGPGIYNLDCGVNFQEVYVVKLDSNANFIWASGAETESGYCSGIVVDANYAVYLAGAFQDTCDFDIGTSVYGIGAQEWDMYAIKLDILGNLVWAKSAGGYSVDGISALAMDSTGALYLSGNYKYTADIAPGPDVYTQSTSGSGNFCVIKLDACTQDIIVDSISACGSVMWLDGQVYSSSTTEPKMYHYNVDGCDSIIKLNLQILNPATSVETIISCDSYTWQDGVTYFSSDTSATFTLPGSAINGCDSIIELNLTLLVPPVGIDNVTSCQDFTWLDGITYTSSNTTATYLMLGAAANGCDSMVTLNLIINTPDIGVLNNNAILSATGIGDYQWLDCNNNFSPITGASSQDYSPDQNGSYAVEVIYNGCVDTSQCFDVQTTSLSEKSNFNSVLATPNPSSGLIFLVGLSEQTVNLIVSDAAGNVLIRDDYYNTIEPIDMSELTEGIYFVSVTTATNLFIITAVKQ